ncbi:MAG: DPP IV N-terminal domain-containing protein [Lysobacterales bacterium]
MNYLRVVPFAIAATILMMTMPVSAETLTVERLFASPDLSGSAPVALKFSPDGSRVSYLKGKPSNLRQQDLWEYHLTDNTHRMLVDSESLLPNGEVLDEVEKARRERMRIGGTGIVEYLWSPDGRQLLFPLGGDLHLYSLDTSTPRQLTHSAAFETDPKVSPKGGFVSFVRDQNLWVVGTDGQNSRQLTKDGKGPIRNAMAEFIAMEEMDRDTGYWWSPDDRFIAFTQVDESSVELATRYQIFDDTFRLTKERYPFTGESNVRIRLGVIEVSSGEINWIDLGDESDIYLARVNWSPSGRLMVQRQSRDQKTLDLLEANPADGSTRTVLTERSEVWLNLHHNLKFLTQSPDQFLWTSERSGFAHIYRYDLSGEMRGQLTDGQWAVSEIKSVDEGRGLVMFDGFADSVLEKHLYAAPLDPVSGGQAMPKIRRITERSGWHDTEVALSRTGSVEGFIDSFSSDNQPPQVSVHTPDGQRITWLAENTLNADHPYGPFANAHAKTEYGTLTAEDGQTLNYSLIKPVDFDPKKTYPAIVYVYGGPHAQVVSNSWGRSEVFHQYLQQQGFVVFSLDNRGSANRGTAFEFPIYEKMSRIEVQDQKAGTQYLKSLSFVDPNRVGIYGWSYGGYMTLMALMQEPGIWAAGISGAPVTDWALYDTHYTERYMNTPAKNADGYETSNVLTYVEQLADPLLLIHGMADDNVLLNHSTALLRSLQQSGKQFETMLYPNETHGFKDPAINTHRTKLMMSFFQRHLGSTATKPTG